MPSMRIVAGLLALSVTRVPSVPRLLLLSLVIPMAILAMATAAEAATPTVTTMTVDPNPTIKGQQYTLTATITPNPGGGTVRWIRNNVYMGYNDGTVDAATGKASVVFTAGAVGSYEWKADFRGNGGYEGSISAPVVQVIKQNATTTSLTSSQSPAAVGGLVTLTAQVTPNPGGGTVTFVYANTNIGTYALDAAGQAQRVIIVKAGSVQARATFNGHGPLGPSTGTFTQVGKYATTTTLSVSADPVEEGKALKLTATVTPAPAGGSVTFHDSFDGSNRTLGTVNVTTGGIATLTTSSLEPGVHALRASFAGTGTHYPSESGPQNVTVIEDTRVEATGVGVQYATFYPVRDRYRDTVSLKGRLGERATVTIRVIDRSGRTVRAVRLKDRAPGPYASRWNGRRPSGSLLPAGTYRVVQRIRDAQGNVATFRSRVTLSHKRLVWRTLKALIAANRYTSSDRLGDGWVRPRPSRYARGLVVHGGSTSGSFARAFYRFRLPRGTLHVRRIFFCAQGVKRRGRATPFVGLSDFAAGRISWVQIPNRRGCWGVEAKGSNATLRYHFVRRGLIEGSIVSSGLYAMSYDAARVGVVIRYSKLVSTRTAATDEVLETDAGVPIAPAPGLRPRSVDDTRWTGRVPKRLRPAIRRAENDWLRDDPPVEPPPIYVRPPETVDPSESGPTTRPDRSSNKDGRARDRAAPGTSDRDEAASSGASSSSASRSGEGADDGSTEEAD